MRLQGLNSNGEPLSSMYVEKDNSDPSFNLDCSNLPSATRQEYADDADINKLMARYETTGLLPTNLNTGTPQYLDVSEVPDMRTALDSLAQATAAFMALPASVRRTFDNDAVKFVEYAQDPANVDDMRTWGLAAPKSEPSIPVVRVEGYEPAPPDAPTGHGGDGSKSKK